MHQPLIARNSQRRRGAGFHSQQKCPFGYESFGPLSEILQSGCQTPINDPGQPFTDSRGMYSRFIGRRRQSTTVLSSQEIGQPLSRSKKSSPTCFPCLLFQSFLECHACKQSPVIHAFQFGRTNSRHHSRICPGSIPIG